MNEPPPAPRPVRFVEPTEGAFSLVIPEGWRIDAGVVRGASDPRPWYRLRSPGGGAELRGSDPRVPTVFQAPGFDPMGMFPTPGVAVRPYAAAVAFAEEYARFFARELGASGFAVMARRDVEAVLRDDPRDDARTRTHQLLQMGAEIAGVEFECTDLALRGVVDVINLRFPLPFGMRWSPIVTALVGPTQAWPHVRATLQHVAASYRTDPAWQQRQSQWQQAQHQMAMDTIAAGSRVMAIQAQSGMDAIAAHAQRARIAAQTSEAVGAMQSASWREEQSSREEAQRRAVNAVRETVDLVDPATGAVYRGAPAGYASYWTDGGDRVIASDGHENPDPARYSEAMDLDAHRRRGPR